MSLVIRFPRVSVVADWLRELAQPRMGHAWTDADSFLVEPEPEGGIWVHLDGFRPDDPAMKEILDQLDCERGKPIPPALLKQRKFTPAEFLQCIKLVAARPGVGRRDLLVAFYETDGKAVGECFGNVPKNPSHPSTVVHLANRPNTDTPHHLILLPQADLGFHWPIWLDAQNQRLGPTPRRKVKLFHRMEGGLTAEYYVEYGYAHPVPLLPRLYPNPNDASLILISGEGRDGKKGTRWVHVAPEEDDSYRDVETPTRDTFAIELQTQPDATVARTAPAKGRLELIPRLVTLGDARRDELDRLEKRIQTARDGLFDLEQQRSGLLDREQNRFFLLLRFRQDKGEMCYEFQRFLVMTQSQLERFDYAFQDEGGGKGFHVVRTREPVFYQDVQVGLATDAYRQELHWHDWRFPIFVRDGYELFPRIDSHELADLFRDALLHPLDPADRPKSEAAVLVEPASGPAGRLKIIVLPIGSDATLKQQLRFLNTSFTASLEQARAAAGKELRERVDETTKHFEDEIDKAEEHLSKEADRRLTKARELWHEVAGRIQTTVREVQRCDDRLDAFNEMVRDFAGRWRGFVDRVLGFNDELIAGKLAALKALERAQTEWDEILARIDKANTDVPGLLAPLRQKMDERLDQAEKRRVEIEALYRELDAREREVRALLDGKCRQVDQWLREVQTGRDRIESKNTELAQKRQELTQLLAAVEAAVVRLRGHVQGFEKELGRTKKGIDDTEALAQKLREQSQEFDRKKLAWADQRGRVERDLAVVREASEQTSRSIVKVDRDILAQKREAIELEKRVAEGLHTLEKDLRDVQASERNTEAQLVRAAMTREQLEDTRKRLQEARERIAKAALVEDGLRQELRETAGALQKVMREKEEARRLRLEDLVAQMEALARRDLDALAEIEVSVERLDPYRKAVKLRSDSVAAAREFERLSEKDYERLYRAEA